MEKRREEEECYKESEPKRQIKEIIESKKRKIKKTSLNEREREKERKRERERDREHGIHKTRWTKRQNNTLKEIKREREREKEKGRERERERESMEFIKQGEPKDRIMH